LLSESIESLLEGIAAKSMDQADARFQALADCLEHLQEADRELIDARYQQGANTNAIASERNRSTDSIYRSLRRIHQALFDCVQRKLHEEGSS
jgi:RNA polymerase sigma-70 factor (ECF subfamily)